MACIESAAGYNVNVPELMEGKSISKSYGGKVKVAMPHGGKVKLNVVWESYTSDDKADQKDDFAVAVYRKIKPLDAALLDSYIDGHQRTTTLFFGRIVSNPDDLPAFAQPLGYNMTYNAMAAHHGNALHRHNSVEIFVALDAPFEIAYGSNGEHKALLKPWDMVACPAEVIHSYKNMGHDGGQILTFLMGKPAIRWADGVVSAARKNGAACDDSGILVKSPRLKTPTASKQKPACILPATLSESESDWDISTPIRLGDISRQSTSTSEKPSPSRPCSVTASDASTVAPSEEDLAEALKRRLSLMGKEAPELVLEAGAMDPFVFRYAERAERKFKMHSGAGSMAVHWKDLQPWEQYTPEGEEDILIIVLGGSVICHERHYAHLDVIKQPKSVAAGVEGAVLLVTRSDLPHNLDFFFDGDLMA